MLVYSAIYGGYDFPKPPRPHPSVTEWRLYTDDPSIYAPGWNVVVEPRPEFAHPRMQAKFRKCCPPIDTFETLYLDASIRLRDPELLEAASNLLKFGASWAMFPHPERYTIHAEFEASRSMRKYEGLESRMLDQVAFYVGHWPEACRSLWAGGIIARNAAHSPAVLQAGSDWLSECMDWSYQDQLSLPVVLARHGINPTPLTAAAGGGLWGNRHFTVEPHRSDL